MIPSWWTWLLLTLGVCRLVRLAGWDTFPPIVRARRWAVGEATIRSGSGNAQMGLTREQTTTTTTYRRPLLEELLGCPFCMGFWMAIVAYAAWWWQPKWTLVVMVPLAINEAVGLLSKNLDP